MWHRCNRWWSFGLGCGFQVLEGHDEIEQKKPRRKPQVDDIIGPEDPPEIRTPAIKQGVAIEKAPAVAAAVEKKVARSKVAIQQPSVIVNHVAEPELMKIMETYVNPVALQAAFLVGGLPLREHTGGVGALDDDLFAMAERNVVRQVAQQYVTEWLAPEDQFDFPIPIFLPIPNKPSKPQEQQVQKPIAFPHPQEQGQPFPLPKAAITLVAATLASAAVVTGGRFVATSFSSGGGGLGFIFNAFARMRLQLQGVTPSSQPVQQRPTMEQPTTG